MVWLFSLEKLCLSLVIGGGTVLGAVVRPLFLNLLRGEATSFTSTVERTSILMWNRYNKLAMGSVFVVFLLELIALFQRPVHSFVHVTLAFLLALGFGGKLLIDKQLKKRAQTDETAHQSTEQQKGHKKVELLTQLILVIAVILMIVPK